MICVKQSGDLWRSQPAWWRAVRFLSAFRQCRAQLRHEWNEKRSRFIARRYGSANATRDISSGAHSQCTRTSRANARDGSNARWVNARRAAIARVAASMSDSGPGAGAAARGARQGSWACRY